MTVARLDAAFARARDEGRAALVTYFMAGDPGLPESLAVVRAAAAAGADVIELGFPFSDPMAEGPSIQRASQRALLHGTTLRDVLQLVREFRTGLAPLPLAGEVDASAASGRRGQGAGPDGSDSPSSGVRSAPACLPPQAGGEPSRDTPIVLMGYLNPVLSYGYAAFARDAAAAGVDGLIVVDCPPEEAEELADALDAEGVALIRLATPTTDNQRLPAVLRRSSGFVYYVSVAGVTGVKSADASIVAPEVARIKRATGLPVAVGFGIRTPEQAAAVARVADGVVVGTALVEAVEQAVEAGASPAAAVGERVAALTAAVRQAR